MLNIDEDNLYMLLQPRCNKDYWENSAILIKQLGYPRIKSIIPGLLEWIQDMNWPGAQIVFEVLRDIEKKDLQVYIEEALEEALSHKDTVWVGWIKELIKKEV